MTRRKSMWTTIIVSVLCDLVIVCMLFYLTGKNANKVADIKQTAAIVEQAMSAELSKMVNESI